MTTKNRTTKASETQKSIRNERFGDKKLVKIKKNTEKLIENNLANEKEEKIYVYRLNKISKYDF